MPTPRGHRMYVCVYACISAPYMCLYFGVYIVDLCMYFGVYIVDVCVCVYCDVL
jgi:hypothetical protein